MILPQQHRTDLGARLVAAMIYQPEVREICAPLELADLADLRQQVALGAIRDLQTASQPIDVLAIDDLLFARDQQRGTTHAQTCGAHYLGLLMFDHWPYGSPSVDPAMHLFDRRHAGECARDLAQLKAARRSLDRVIGSEMAHAVR